MLPQIDALEGAVGVEGVLGYMPVATGLTVINAIIQIADGRSGFGVVDVSIPRRAGGVVLVHVKVDPKGVRIDTLDAYFDLVGLSVCVYGVKAQQMHTVANAADAP
jgi:hypothetical protein